MVMWSKERDRILLHCRAGSIDAATIVRELERHDVIVTAADVRRRLKALGKPIRTAHEDRYWTRERDEQLRQLWGREPRLLIDAIRETLGANVSTASISRRAMELSLPPRNASAGKPRVNSKPLAGEGANRRSQYAPGTQPQNIETPARRVVRMPLDTPCPFYHPMEMDGPCGVMVNRRPGNLGIRPSQYCEKHAARVMPIERGTLGALAIFGVGVRFYK